MHRPDKSSAFLAPLLAALWLTGCNSLPERQLASEAVAPTSKPSPATPIENVDETETRDAFSPAPRQLAAPAAIPPTDLWQRLRQGYRLSIPDQPSIRRQIEWYSAHPKYLERLRDRAEPYLHFIMEEIDKRGMPSELALLPAVESAFQPFAYSPGRAAGLWQFIPSTGKYYGLEQNWWYDGRRDVVAATRAALDYLQTMHERFDGDWELALAAYNAGAGTVDRAIRKNRKQGKPTDYWSLKLPSETERYVPKLLAVAKIVGEPAEHGLNLPPIPNEPHFVSIDIGSQLDLALAAEMADLPIETLYQLNPGFNRWATPPEGPHRLNLPLEQAEPFTDRLAELDPQKRLQWKRYAIRRGDSLAVIARKHHTSVALLQQVNDLKGHRIRAGAHLLIPVASRSLDHYALSQGQRLAGRQQTPRKGTKTTYRVKAGDTLWDIARNHNVSHRAIASWNGISPVDTLRPGQKLVIWHEQAETSKISQARSPFKKVSSINYRVRRGDSLARIAERFNVSVANLREWNELPGKTLQPGQQLTLYVDVTQQI